MHISDILDWLYPPKCMICDGIICINEEKWLCPLCKDTLTRIEGAACAKCGRPSDTSGVCPECRGRALFFEKNHPIFVYDDVMKSLIHKYKYGRHPGYGRGLGGIAAKYLDREIFEKTDYLIPVPLHPRKRRQRGYNQSERLASGITGVYKLPVRTDILYRIKDTKPQFGLNPRERDNNIKNAFSVAKPKELLSKNVVLVDDIYTTGSTLSECSRALLASGAGRIVCVTLAAAMPRQV